MPFQGCSLLLQLLLLLVTSELYVAATEVYYVTPNSHFSLNNYTNTLQHYLDNKNMYFTNFKDIQLHFLPGIHFLSKNFIIKKKFTFTLSGNSSVIECSNRQVGISVRNTLRFIMKNITLAQCNMKCNNIRNHNGTTMYNWNAALFLQECDSGTITNVSIIVNASINGLVAVNNHMTFTITNLTVRVKCSLNNVSLPHTNGLVLYSYYSKKLANISYYLINYTYKPDALCSKISSQCALSVLLIQSKYNTYVKVSNTTFTNLYNVTLLNYYGASYVNTQKLWNIIAFYNCKISRNIGTALSKMFSFIIHGDGYSFGSEYETNSYRAHYNILKFYYCTFSDNSNFTSLLHLLAKNTLSSNTIMKIGHCNILYNSMTTILKIISEVKVFWQISVFANIASTNISFNIHRGRHNLLSVANAIIKLSDFVTIKNNSYYYSIFMLHLSLLKFYGHSEVCGNQVRHVFSGKEASYYLVNENTKIIIMHNILFSILSQSKIYNEHYQQMCFFQFFSKNSSLDELVIHNQSLNYKIVIMDNIYTAPIHILKYRNIFPGNCLWLFGTAFQMVNSSDVYGRIVKRTLQSIDRSNIGTIPSSICQCVNLTEYDCTSHELGTIYPGQTISTKLIVPRLILIPQNSITLRVLYKDLPPNGCRVTKVNEISQTYIKPTCNEYNYTIWSDKSSCELYLDSTGSMETFYVDLQPCPLGFSLQEDKQGCVCDSALNSDIISVTSCNLNDATILRPANSWIFAIKSDDTQFYKVSSHCPFDYCLPHASNINLSSPDSQCQFNRSGVLCGHCGVGLSSIFGSSQCKQCSNVYLLIVIPIVLAGIVLVIMLFIFNITINNGIMNTFIFYVNIISINFSMFFPQCNSVVCVFISLANLDLGIETCFYNGMNDYAKMWLQLTFPVYLFLIAHLLIIGSRYSSRIQRLTAQKALPVLATLLLLSYTKILLTVCRVLFFFSRILHLPSRHVEYTWSVDTSIHLFGINFSILFAICLMLFIILLPFNCLLLFIRPLSCFKLINKFKPLLDVYRGPYKDKYCYWTGLYLLMRAIFFGLSAFDRGISLTCGIILLGILLCIQGIVHPFKCTLMNIQESFILLNLLSIYVVAYYSNSNAGIKIVQFLIIIVFVYFAIFITCRCIMSTCGKRIREKTSWITMLRKSNTRNKNHSKGLEISNDITDDSYIEFQEPLIALETYT